MRFEKPERARCLTRRRSFWLSLIAADTSRKFRGEILDLEKITSPSFRLRNDTRIKSPRVSGLVETLRSTYSSSQSYFAALRSINPRILSVFSVYTICLICDARFIVPIIRRCLGPFPKFLRRDSRKTTLAAARCICIGCFEIRFASCIYVTIAMSRREGRLSAYIVSVFFFRFSFERVFIYQWGDVFRSVEVAATTRWATRF